MEAGVPKGLTNKKEHSKHSKSQALVFQRLTEFVNEVVIFPQREGRVCAGNPRRVSCAIEILSFQNFYKVLKTGSAGRKDFFDTLKPGVGFPTPDFLCGSTARAPVGYNLPFVRSRHQAQGQDCNISVFNRFTQINVVSDLFAGFRYKIEHIEI